MSVKAILFDADGVVIKRQSEYFSVRFTREHGAPREELTAFFKSKFRECQIGKADLKAELEPLLSKWGWAEGADAYLRYWFSNDTETNPEVLKVVEDFRAKGVGCYLATDQEKYRARYIREELDLKNKFDGEFFSCDIGFSKSEPEFFAAVLEKLQFPAADVMYFDDDEENVKVAKSLGIDAYFYTGLKDFETVQS